MRDWFSASSLYIPCWVVAGTIMGLWGTGMSPSVAIAWVAIGLAIAGLAWRASAHQVREGREIRENLGKLVNVTEPSPVNILAAAGAKILTLEHAQDELKSQLDDWTRVFWRRMRDDEKVALKGSLAQLGKHSVRIVNAERVDCTEVAGDLRGVFESAGWEVQETPLSTESMESDLHYRASVSGLLVLAKFRHPTGKTAKGVADALRPIVKGISSAYVLAPIETADVVLVVGPKAYRSTWP